MLDKKLLISVVKSDLETRNKLFNGFFSGKRVAA